MSITPEPVLQFLLPEKVKYFKGKVYKLSDAEISSIIEKTPPLWWNDKDEVIFFTYYNDGSYFCERKKDVYDFKNQITIKKVYEFVEPTLEDAKEWYDILVQCLEEIRLEQLRNSKEEVKQKVLESGKILRNTLENYRNQLLKRSDFTQLPDVPFTEEVRDLWKKYRQYLRDITEDLNWYTNNFFLVDFPKTPFEYLDLHPNKEIEYLSTEDQFNNYGANTVKLKLARLMDYLASPELSSESQNPRYLAGEDLQVVFDQPYQQFMERINKYLARIDPDLKYEVVFVEQKSDPAQPKPPI